jgi:hypothetical protein
MVLFTSSFYLRFLAMVWLSYLGASAEVTQTVFVTETVTLPGRPVPPSASPSTFQMPPQASQPPTPMPPNQPVPSGLTTLTSQSASKAPSVPSPALPAPSQTHLGSNASARENGEDYGNVIIRNHCKETLYLASVGVHPLGGFRDDSKGWGTPEDEIRHQLEPGSTYTEPYRITCPIPVNNSHGYCSTYDTLYGQGVSMKIGRTNISTEILQIEYALVKNPMRVPPATFQRLEYDISLLDCGDPHVMPNAFGGQVAITDALATPDNHKVKVDNCPGYQNGISVSFPAQPRGQKCKSINCDGKSKCSDIYTFDRTRPEEASFSCEEEYKGDMVVDLCAGESNVTALR